MSKPVCLVTAPVATRSGYGAHSRDIVRSLIKLDRYDIKHYDHRWDHQVVDYDFDKLTYIFVVMNLEENDMKFWLDQISANPEN